MLLLYNRRIPETSRWAGCMGPVKTNIAVPWLLQGLALAMLKSTFPQIEATVNWCDDYITPISRHIEARGFWHQWKEESRERDISNNARQPLSKSTCW